MVARILLVLFCIFSMLNASSQKDTTQSSVALKQNITAKNQSGESQIEINESDSISKIVHKYARISKKNGYIYGWRIQIFYSSNSEAKDKCSEAKTKFLKKYPDIKAYTIYQPPVFRVRVGDFRTKHEAFQLYKELLPMFPVSYLVQDKINLPKVD